jgi:hypothetical protein
VSAPADRYLAAHHEAGHAVAAQKRCGYVTEIYIDPFEGHTGHDSDPSDLAFIIYAGPWAHVRARCTEATFDRVRPEMQGNYADHHDYEKAVGGNVAAVEQADFARLKAHDGLLDWSEVPRAPVTQPDPAWDSELERLWPDIQELATQLLAAEPEIPFGGGPPLKREAPNYWRRQR